jgi:hypothetical protein
MFYLRLNYSSAAEPAAIQKSGKSRRSRRNSGFKDLLDKVVDAELENFEVQASVLVTTLSQITTFNPWPEAKSLWTFY